MVAWAVNLSGRWAVVMDGLPGAWVGLPPAREAGPGLLLCQGTSFSMTAENRLRIEVDRLPKPKSMWKFR